MTQTVTEIAEGFWVVEIPTDSSAPSPGTTNCCVIVNDSGRVTLIDPGDDCEEALPALAAALEDIGLEFSSIDLIIASHLHRDHMGLAAQIQEISDAAFAIHEADYDAIVNGSPSVDMTIDQLMMWGVPAERWPELQDLPRLPRDIKHPRWDMLLHDNQVISAPGRAFRITHVPGHTAGHIAILEQKSGILMTGDLILPLQNPGIGLGGQLTNPLWHYQESVKSAALIPHDIAIPGHGKPMENLSERCSALLAHHSKRSGEVARIIRESPQATVWGIAEQLSWSRGWNSLAGSELRLALHHVDIHLHYLTQPA
jgi:glyoxylase-like metal-dependent hydrolase (beta-lactamase superfamily II)